MPPTSLWSFWCSVYDRNRSTMARWGVCGPGLLCWMACRFGQVFAEGFAGTPHIYKSELRVLLCWLDVSHQMCHRPGVLMRLRRFYIKPFLYACGPWSSSGKRMRGLTMSANIPCRYEFVQASSESKTSWRKKKSWESWRQVLLLVEFRWLEKFCSIGEKIRKITQKPPFHKNNTKSACFHLISKWVLF